jgi:hypothetical protein
MHGYVCRSCGQYHEGLPLSYGAEAPALWYLLPEAERQQRAELSSDLCVIDEQYFFILGNIEIAIQKSDQFFAWSVWVSLSEANFARTLELWETPGRENEPPYFGWLSTQLPCYPDTLRLKTHVHIQPVGQRPIVELEATDHPLAIEQRTGMTWDRIQEIAENVLHNAT